MKDLKKRRRGLYPVFLILFTLLFLVLVSADNQILLENDTEIGQLEILPGNGVEMPVIIKLPTETIPGDSSELPEEGSTSTGGAIIESSVNNVGPETTPIVEEPGLIETFISLVVNGVKVFVGEVVNIKAILTDENYTPIPDKQIDFYADNLIGSDFTDDAGVAEISWNTSGYSHGLHIITANYSGDELLRLSSTDIEISVEGELLNVSAEDNNEFLLPLERTVIPDSPGRFDYLRPELIANNKRSTEILGLISGAGYNVVRVHFTFNESGSYIMRTWIRTKGDFVASDFSKAQEIFEILYNNGFADNYIVEIYDFANNRVVTYAVTEQELKEYSSGRMSSDEFKSNVDIIEEVLPPSVDPKFPNKRMRLNR